MNKILAVMLLLVSGIGCAQPSVDTSIAAAHAAVTLAKHTALGGGDTPAPQPDDPAGDECTNCGGDGVLGDTTVEVECPVCDGTGRITSGAACACEDCTCGAACECPAGCDDGCACQAPAASAQPHASITLLSLPGCPPCERWKATMRPQVVAAGWHVTEQRLTSGTAPQFRVCIGDACYVHQGYLTNADLRRIVQRHSGEPAVQARPASVRYAEPQQFFGSSMQGGGCSTGNCGVPQRRGLFSRLWGR